MNTDVKRTDHQKDEDYACEGAQIKEWADTLKEQS